jgi:hypothetical protein
MKHKAKGKMPTARLTAQNQSAIKTAHEFVRHVRHIGGRAPDRRYLDDGWHAPVLLLYLVLVVGSPVALCATLDVQEIIRKSVTVNEVDWKAAPEYSFTERDHGRNGTKTYEVTMIEGSPYQRLIAVNGKTLSAQGYNEEERKLQHTLTARQTESKGQRDERIAKYESDRKQDHLLMGQLTVAFDFKLVSEMRMDKHEVYLLRASPRKGYRPPNMESQVLRGMQGQLWIDKKTFQWVKVTARVISPVSIEGFLAEVEPGTYFELERMPVAEGIWLPKHFAMKSRSKIFYLIGHNTQDDETYLDYRKIEPIKNH